MADINVYGTLKTMAEDQKVAYANQVFDEDLNKDQHTINLELDEKIDYNVEELKEDVFGDEWVDEIHGRRFLSLGSEYGWYRNYSILRKNSTLVGDWNTNVIGFKVKAGDKFRLVGISTNTATAGWNTAPMACFYDIYEVPTASGSSPSNYTFPNAQYVGSYSPEKERPIDDIVEIPQGVGMVAFMATKSGVVSSGGYLWYAADDKSSCYRYLGNVLSIADKTGYKIDTWTDNEIITSTTLAVGSVMPYWSDGTRYGCRGVRLNVKEGDKVLLDTYSPALFGLIFTDENRVVKALYDDRRFDGVWTAPCDGYCYIQDVLYRDCYHYSSAHGHLAYMAYDARKRVAKGGDWYNEYAMRRITQILPLECSFKKTGSGNSGWVTQFVVDGTTNLTAMNGGQYVLVLFKYYVYEDSASSGNMTTNGSTGIGTAVYSQAGVFTPGTYQYTYRIYRNVTNAGTMFGAYWYNISADVNTHVRFDKVFVHTSSDFAELYQLAQKIINGEVEVDNFYGVKEKEVDFVKNAIGLQSISDLGYNILDHGATLPIDEDGYKYAKEIYDRYKDNPPSGDSWAASKSPFYNNKNVVYVPSIDFSHFAKTGSDYLKQAFINCTNLVCIDDIQLPSDAQSTYTNYLQYMVSGCVSLKYVGNIATPPNKTLGLTAFAEGCYALEYVGRITGGKPMGFSLVFKNCYSLKRIEELPFEGMPNPANNEGFLNCINLEYLLCKDFGKSSTMTAFGVFQKLDKWGINSDENPDARQSLVDSLLTYSYDRVNDPDGLGTAGTTCTITLSANSYAQLTASEIEQINAKGYTLTHP